MTLTKSQNVLYVVRILSRISIYLREIFALKKIDDDKIIDSVMAVLK